MILFKFGEKNAVTIKGTSIVDGYKDWIVLDSYAFNVSRHVQVQGKDRPTSEPFMSEVMLTKGGDISSPELFVQTLSGTSLKEAHIVVPHPKGTKGDEKLQLLNIKLIEPIISSFSTQNVDGSRPIEHFSLNFTKIEYEFFYFDGDKQITNVGKNYDLIEKKTY